MTHSGFKTAQRIVNLHKKENNNKDYRYKMKVQTYYKFSSGPIDLNYILRTKHSIYLNEKNLNYLLYDYVYDMRKNPHLIFFEEHSDEENIIIQDAIHNYYNLETTNVFCSRDKTRSEYSKISTKNRNKDRKQKFILNQIS